MSARRTRSTSRAMKRPLSDTEFQGEPVTKRRRALSTIEESPPQSKNQSVMSAQHTSTPPRTIKRPFGGASIPGEPLTKRRKVNQIIEETPPEKAKPVVPDPKDLPPLRLLAFSKMMAEASSRARSEMAQTPRSPLDPRDLDAETLQFLFKKDVGRYKEWIKAERVPMAPRKKASRVEWPLLGSRQGSIDNDSSEKEATRDSQRRKNPRRNYAEGSRKVEDVAPVIHPQPHKRKRSPSPQKDQQNKKPRPNPAQKEAPRRRLPWKSPPPRHPSPEQPEILEPAAPPHPLLGDLANFTLTQRLVLCDQAIELKQAKWEKQRAWLEWKEQLAELTLERTRMKFELDNQRAEQARRVRMEREGGV
ncbi:hypothetical protein GMOD_00010047 [Pyrenophora seminiperda CCB06]|uniref:Uncharacterized protein n=1 Tax=Pyrenophora seminiperda CCB06 TaxID=1302712 RepID=A0A3M7M1M8_9PLEO|nr:hypothetical protein GMOD_00010047 [Pyrenophora seminiperda CCB06]